LNRLATATGSLLDDSAAMNVPGVSIPWLYVGGLFAAFCWHTEDLWMYSCNHLHAGAPKTWYVIPASASSKFERAVRSLLPQLFAQHPDLLYQLVAMVAPADLRAQGVPVYQLTQRAGEFVITFPRAYHAGFSHGFNCAEAVNFATPDWLPYGRHAMACYRRHKRSPVLSVERLLCKMALRTASEPIDSRSRLSPSDADWVLPELRAVVADEIIERSAMPPGCHYMHTLGHSPVDSARRRAKGATASDDGDAAGLQADEDGSDAEAAELAELGRCTSSNGRAFGLFDTDVLTCVECNRVLFLSGITCLRCPPKEGAAAATAAAVPEGAATIEFPADSSTDSSTMTDENRTSSPPALGTANGAAAADSTSAPPPASTPASSAPPLSSCLRHVASLHRHVLAAGSGLGTAPLAAWRRHDDAFLHELCEMVKKRVDDW